MLASFTVSYFWDIDDSLTHLDKFALGLKLKLESRKGGLVELGDFIEYQSLVFGYCSFDDDAIVLYLFSLGDDPLDSIWNEVDLNPGEERVFFNL